VGSVEYFYRTVRADKMESTRTDQLTVEIVNNLRAALDAQISTNEKMRASWEEIANRAHELSNELEDTKRQLRKAKRKLAKMQDVLLEEECQERVCYGSIKNVLAGGETRLRNTANVPSFIPLNIESPKRTY